MFPRITSHGPVRLDGGSRQSSVRFAYVDFIIDHESYWRVPLSTQVLYRTSGKLPHTDLSIAVVQIGKQTRSASCGIFLSKSLERMNGTGSYLDWQKKHGVICTDVYERNHHHLGAASTWKTGISIGAMSIWANPQLETDPKKSYQG